MVHSYVYDSAGRLAYDVASAPSGWGDVDHDILAIGTTYDDIGRVEKVTCYSALTQVNGQYVGDPNHVANEVEYVYDSWGNLAAEYQEHDGAVDANTLVSVQYTYSDGYSTSGSDRPAPYVRPTDVVYRNGRDVQYGYGTANAIDDIMSRLETITDNDGASVAYKYLGTGQIVEEDYVTSQTKLSYLDGSGNVTGLDRFGRIEDQIWTDYGADPDAVIDHYHYEYDRAGNRVSKDNVLNEDLNETYVYDDVNRLKAWYVDDVLQKEWTLDSLGNNLDAGDYNAANEETPTGLSGDVYDAAGNMILLQSGDTAKYDAWNRMVKVDDASSNILQQNVYDGTNRRIRIYSDFTGATPDAVQEDYYSGQQVTLSYTFDGDSNFQGGQAYIWSPRYIDAPILRDTYSANHDLVTAARVLYLGDANYNVTGLVKQIETESGPQWQVVERYTYTPYGFVTYRDADWTDVGSSANANTTLYTGRLLDTLTSLYYNRARFYDALLERFVNRDPIASSPNLYEYCGDSPLDYVDPLGLKDVPVTTAGQSNTDWMIKNIVDQIMKNGGYPESARGGLTDYVKSIFYKGCIGFTSLQVANPTRVVDKNGKLLGTLPNVENCYASFAEAQKVQKEWDKAGKCACDENHTTIPGGKGKARIFAVQYSSEGVNPKPDSIRRYNLTTDPNVLISIWTPADPDKIPFDFFFFSNQVIRGIMPPSLGYMQMKVAQRW